MNLRFALFALVSCLPVGEAKADTTIKLFNINIARSISTNSDFNSTASNALARLLNHYQPDVITFQEVAIGDNNTAETVLRNWVVAKLGYMGGAPEQSFYTFAGTTRDGGGLRQVIISRFPLTNKQSFPDGLRGITSARVDLPGPDAAHVFTVHFKAFGDADSAAQRQNNAVTARNAMQTHRANFPLVPFIITGDMNEDESNPQTPLTAAYRPITTVLQAGLINQLYLDCQGGSKTISVTNPTRRFDYVLPSNFGFGSVSGMLINTRRMSQCGTLPVGLNSTDSANASDHVGVFATLTVLSPRTTAKLSLDGWVGPVAGRQVNVVIRTGGGTVVAQGNATLNAAGEFTLPITDYGNYTVRVDTPGFLALARTNIALPAAGTVNFGPAVAGDTNDDNVIDDADLTNLILDFGAGGNANGITDANGDGQVDDADLTLLILGFGETGAN